MPATLNLQQSIADDLDVYFDFQQIRDEIRPTLGGGLNALCHMVEELSPAGMHVLEIDASLLGNVIHELIGLDAFMDQLLAIEEVPSSWWCDYRRSLLPTPPGQSSHLVQLLHGLAACEMDETGQLTVAPDVNLTTHASAVRWKVLTPAVSQVGALLAANSFHSRAILNRLPAMAAFVRECHAGMAWVDALGSRSTAQPSHSLAPPIHNDLSSTR
ncbi:hypothetical protein [Billgrantia desiderata]|uniref:hypothetical protein n=1 Tax=Billgrantia desiderata TaxID=52021 RepID=UPI003F3DA358